MKVSSKTNCSSCAGALSQQLREGENVDLQCIGAGALNQAIKAVIIAKGHLAPLGFDLVCRMNFVNLEIEGKERTGIRISVRNDVAGMKAQPELERRTEEKEKPETERKPRKKGKMEKEKE